jgi:hypothetical protein
MHAEHADQARIDRGPGRAEQTAAHTICVFRVHRLPASALNAYLPDGAARQAMALRAAVHRAELYGSMSLNPILPPTRPFLPWRRRQDSKNI